MGDSERAFEGLELETSSVRGHLLVVRLELEKLTHPRSEVEGAIVSVTGVSYIGPLVAVQKVRVRTGGGPEKEGRADKLRRATAHSGVGLGTP